MSNFSKSQWIPLLLAAGILCAGQSVSQAAIVINELMASNNSTLADPQGEYDDWIEFYNHGTASVNMAGMYVTDDLDEPTKWQFPSNQPTLTTIAPGGYLLLWADGDAGDAGLHASFNLNASGEEVALFSSDGVALLDNVSFDEQNGKISYGRFPDGGSDWMVMVMPTPGDENVGLASGVVATPQFSHERGFYDQAFMLELTTSTEGATIYYRLDGVDPGASSGHGESGTRYTGPIPIYRTTCVRAAASRSGWLPSSTVTMTYIFPSDVIRQSASPAGFPSSWGGRGADYAMDQRVVDDPKYSGEIKDDLQSTPSVCIVIAIADFFGSGGIYANPTATGPTSERAASIEWIDPATGENFGVNAGLRIHGGPYSRSQNPKNAFRVNFRAEYGVSRLEFPLFPDSEVETFDSLALRSIWNYSWSGHCGMSGPTNADYLRDAFARDTVRDMGGLSPHGRGVQVYINGLYWGLYILTERPNDDFAADHLGGDEEDYEVLEAPSGMGASTQMDVVAGGPETVKAWNDLFTLANANLVQPDAYEAIQAGIDIPTMIEYMLMIYYTGSRDAPVFLGDSYTPRNFYAIRHRDPVSPFVLVPWDTEWALEEPTVNRVNVVGVLNPHVLMDRCMTNADFRMLLADRIYRHFFHGGTLTKEGTTARYLARAAEIRGAIVGESARWGDEPRPSKAYTREDWEGEVNRLVNQYFSGRTQTVFNQLKSKGWYPPISPPEFLVNDQPMYGGNIDSSHSLVMDASVGAVWYTLDGADPRLPGSGGDAGPAQESTWIPESAPKKVLVPTGPISDNWRGGAAFDDSGWIGGTGGVGYERSAGYEQYFSINMSQRMYGISGTCYIRIPFALSSEQRKDISSLMLKVRYDDAFVAYLNGVEVQRAMFDGTPAWNSVAPTNHNDGDAIILEAFDISAHLDKLRDGQNILAIHGLNAGVTSSDFLISVELVASKSAISGLPTGVSPTAVRYQGPIHLDESVPVKARALNGNTWSALADVIFAVGPVAQNLRISEIMYHPADTGSPDDPNTEYIELTNIGSETINLNMVSFTRGISFTFPSFELAPSRYCLVVKDIGAFEGKYSTGLPLAGQYTGSLSNGGERLTLLDALGTLVHDFQYNDNWYDRTDGDGFSLTVKDPGTADPDAYGDENLWRSSTKAGGSPGTADK